MNPTGTRSCYDEGKRCAESLFFDYHRKHDIKIKVMRIFNTYGPRMSLDDGRVVSNFIVQALRGKDLTIYGDGAQSRSFCYVDDLIEGMILLMISSKRFIGPVNAGNPIELTMMELAELVIRLTGSSSELVFEARPLDDPARRKPDIELARTKLGWSPVVSLEDGLQKTIEYFRNRI